jgi:hypothetical protein
MVFRTFCSSWRNSSRSWPRGTRIEGAEGLVEQQDRRIEGECPGDPDPLPLAAGQLARMTAADPVLCREVHQFEQGLDPAPDPCRTPALQLAGQADVARDAEVREQPAGLDHVADAAPQSDRIDCAKVPAADQDPAGARLGEAVDQLEGGGLAAESRLAARPVTQTPSPGISAESTRGPASTRYSWCC